MHAADLGGVFRRTSRSVMRTVSVVIPAFNAARVIRRALESVLAQTVRPDEVLVIDDGSTDETRKVVEACGRFLTYIRQDNAGSSGARNRGIVAARGDWV